MNQLREKDQLILQKEQDLNQLIVEYYTFDMSELKNEIDQVMAEE